MLKVDFCAAFSVLGFLYLHINEMGIANEIKNAKSLDVLVLKTFCELLEVLDSERE